MLDWLNTFAGWLSHPEVRAILIGLILSWNLTQLVKNAPALVRLPELQHRWWTRAIAFLIGAAPTAILWPSELAESLLVAGAVGFAAPVIYAYGARVLYHYFPWLEPKMSAMPVAPKDGSP
jgi:hypothetical protein